MLDLQTIIAIASGDNLDVVAKAVASTKCLLFLGSGAHFPSAAHGYHEGECPPLGGRLAAALAAKCGFSIHFPDESVSNLQRVAQCYEVEHGRAALAAEIKEAVHAGKRPSPALRALAALPFQLVITTNYDQLFERALREAGKGPRVVVYSPEETVRTPDHRDISPREPVVLKLHGDIQTPNSLVVTDEDYIHFVLRMSDKDPYHPVPETFRYLFKEWPTLFVGYSLRDYNFRLLFRSLRWGLDPVDFPRTYSVDPYPDPLIFDRWHNRDRLVTFIAQDVWTFVPGLYSRVTGQEMSP